jgi:hypothetical protein
MEVIRDRDGKVISQSQNLAGIRRFVTKKDAPTIKVIAIDRIGEKNLEGKLMILFENGDNYETNFASFTVLCRFVSQWRSVRGSPLRIDGTDAGTVSVDNPSEDMPVCEWCGKYVSPQEDDYYRPSHKGCALANSDYGHIDGPG